MDLHHKPKKEPPALVSPHLEEDEVPLRSNRREKSVSELLDAARLALAPIRKLAQSSNSLVLDTKDLSPRLLRERVVAFLRPALQQADLDEVDSICLLGKSSPKHPYLPGTAEILRDPEKLQSLSLVSLSRYLQKPLESSLRTAVLQAAAADHSNATKTAFAFVDVSALSPELNLDEVAMVALLDLIDAQQG